MLVSWTSASQPNVILIVADDLGIGDITYYNNESKINTPTLTKMAEEGVAFSDAHSSASVCAPSRYSILTGNYPWRGKNENGIWSPMAGSQILAGQETLGQLFKKNNYVTGFFGKWNLGGNFYKKSNNEFAYSFDDIDFSKPFRFGPTDYGYDRGFYLAEGIQKPPYAFIDQENIVDHSKMVEEISIDVQGVELKFPGPGQKNWSTKIAPKTILDSLTSFLTANKNEKFFLTFSMLESHWPLAPLDSLGGMRIKNESNISKRSDLVLQIDATVHVIVEHLTMLNIYDDTIIIFTSDNGASIYDAEIKANHKSNNQWYSGKGTIYEGGHRVPLIISGGSNYLEGMRSVNTNQLIGLTDIYASLSNLLDLNFGVQSSGIDSEDIFSLNERQFLLYQSNLVGEDLSKYAIRHRNHVLTFNKEYVPLELFDLGDTENQSDLDNLIFVPDMDSIISAHKKKFLEIRNGIVLDTSKNKTSIFPNPCIDKLISSAFATNGTSTIFSIDGRTQLEGLLTTGTSEINVDILKKGNTF